VIIAQEGGSLSAEIVLATVAVPCQRCRGSPTWRRFARARCQSKRQQLAEAIGTKQQVINFRVVSPISQPVWRTGLPSFR